MSRSNTNYFNVCEPYQHYDGTWSGIIGEDGFCDWHRDRKFYRRDRVCIPAREFETRRGIYRRKSRFPRVSWKSIHGGNPPRDVMRYWNKQVRQAYRREILFDAENAGNFDGEKWRTGRYSWWF